jgi:hypothetical protein
MGCHAALGPLDADACRDFGGPRGLGAQGAYETDQGGFSGSIVPAASSWGVPL